MSLITGGRAPRIFHLPLCRLALGIEVDGHERHGVGRGGSKGADAVGLVHREVCAEEVGVVVVAQREDARFGVVAFAHVAREIEHRAVLDRGDGEGLDLVHGEVDVRPLAAVVRVTVVLDGVGLVVGARGVVHHHDVVVLQVIADVGFVERERRVGLGFYGFAIRVLARPRELCGRRAEADGEHAVHGGEHFRFALLQGGGFLAFRHGGAERKAIFAQFEGDEVAHA